MSEYSSDEAESTYFDEYTPNSEDEEETETIDYRDYQSDTIHFTTTVDDLTDYLETSQMEADSTAAMEYGRNRYVYTLLLYNKETKEYDFHFDSNPAYLLAKFDPKREYKISAGYIHSKDDEVQCNIALTENKKITKVSQRKIDVSKPQKILKYCGLDCSQAYILKYWIDKKTDTLYLDFLSQELINQYPADSFDKLHLCHINLSLYDYKHCDECEVTYCCSSKKKK